MKALLLAGGYGTRLERDLRSDSGKDYRHLIDVPKPLLPIGDKPLASRWMECLEDVSDDRIQEVFVVVGFADYSCMCSLGTAINSEPTQSISGSSKFIATPTPTGGALRRTTGNPVSEV